MPDTFALRALAVALHQMFTSPRFSICTVDDALKVLGATRTQDYDALRLLHGVEWSQMPPALVPEVRERTLALLRPTAPTMEVLLAELSAPPVESKGLLRRLVG